MENSQCCVNPVQCAVVHDLQASVMEMRLEINTKVNTVMELLQSFFESWKESEADRGNPNLAWDHRDSMAGISVEKEETGYNQNLDNIKAEPEYENYPKLPAPERAENMMVNAAGFLKNEENFSSSASSSSTVVNNVSSFVRSQSLLNLDQEMELTTSNFQCWKESQAEIGNPNLAWDHRDSMAGISVEKETALGTPTSDTLKMEPEDENYPEAQASAESTPERAENLIEHVAGFLKNEEDFSPTVDDNVSSFVQSRNQDQDMEITTSHSPSLESPNPTTSYSRKIRMRVSHQNVVSPIPHKSSAKGMNIRVVSNGGKEKTMAVNLEGRKSKITGLPILPVKRRRSPRAGNSHSAGHSRKAEEIQKAILLYPGKYIVHDQEFMNSKPLGRLKEKFKFTSFDVGQQIMKLEGDGILRRLRNMNNQDLRWEKLDPKNFLPGFRTTTKMEHYGVSSVDYAMAYNRNHQDSETTPI